MKDITSFETSSDLYENADIGMYYCGKRLETLNHTYGPAIRNYYLFVLVNKGEATFYHPKGAIKLKAHDMLIMCPGEKIHYVADTPWSIQWIGLYGQTVDNCVKSLSISGDNPIIHVKQYHELKLLIDELYSISGNRFEDARYYQISLIYKFFSLLFQNSNQKIKTDIVTSAKKIIDYNFDKELSVVTIAESLYTDTSYLIRKFTEKQGISPKEYIIEKRLVLAKKLLRETDSSVIEISNSVGYSDQFYFSRIFKKKVGMSPTAYRKSENEL